VLVGHLALAMGAKRTEPRLPLWALLAAVFCLDLLWPLFLLLGLESVRVHPGDTAFTSLAFDHYPWSHSLTMSLVWSGLAVVLGRVMWKTWRNGWILGFLVLSHWILDFVTHRPDLPLWPGGPLVGLGLWNSVPGTFIVEGGLFVGSIWYYLRGTRARDRTGRYSFAALIVFFGCIWATQPWASPPPSSTAVAWVGLIFWLVLPWAAWIDRHRVVS